MIRIFSAGAALGTLALISPAAAQSPAEFYKGKTVTIIVSSAPGGGYDRIARLVGAHLGKHVPGNPKMVVKNMPGAGGIIAPNFIYAKGDRDGTVIGLMQNTIPFEPLAGNKKATFKPTEFGWLGSPTVETGVMMIYHRSKVRSIADAQKIEVPTAVPAMASTPAFNSRLLMKTLGLKLKIIPGFRSSTAALLAMEQGEADGFPNFYSSMMGSRPTWLKEGKTFVIVQWGPQKEADLPNVPFLLDIVKTPEDKALVKLASASLALGRPFMMPPGVPKDRLTAMRKAFVDTFKDPEFVKDAGKGGYNDLAPQTGEQMEKVIAEAYASPPAVVEQLKLLASGKP
ncbi:MAG: Bug family tripartite tricarboxylate transporter substrate binding protein [Beijerinckiaceae bacterium]